MKKRGIKTIAIILILIGIIILLNTYTTITGFAVLNNLTKTTSSILGIIFVIGGILLLQSGRTTTGGLEVFISNKALEKSEKDKTVEANLSKYRNEIRMVAADPLHRPQERIGEFQVSPKLNTKYRIAWHHDRRDNRLYVDDLLYHVTDKDYDGKWNKKAAKGEIKIEDYEKSGYQPAGSL